MAPRTLLATLLFIAAAFSTGCRGFGGGSSTSSFTGALGSVEPPPTRAVETGSTS